MGKGILTLGCSYTWGEGLYFYSELDDLPLKPHHTFDFRDMRGSFIAFKDKYRYSNLLSEYYNTWYISGSGNGGDNIFSFNQRMDEIFKFNNAKINDFSLVVFQFTSFNRNENYNLIEQIEYIDLYLKKFENEGVVVLSIVWPDDIVSTEVYKTLFKKRHCPIIYNNTSYDSFDKLVNNSKFDLTIAYDFKEKNYSKMIHILI